MVVVGSQCVLGLGGLANAGVRARNFSENARIFWTFWRATFGTFPTLPRCRAHGMSQFRGAQATVREGGFHKDWLIGDRAVPPVVTVCFVWPACVAQGHLPSGGEGGVAGHWDGDDRSPGAQGPAVRRSLIPGTRHRRANPPPPPPRHPRASLE